MKTPKVGDIIQGKKVIEVQSFRLAESWTPLQTAEVLMELFGYKLVRGVEVQLGFYANGDPYERGDFVKLEDEA